MKIKISSVGLYIPPKIETANELAKKINKSEKWIIDKSGVNERRISTIDVDKMGSIAGLEALENGKEPDLIINEAAVFRAVINERQVQ